MLGLKLIHVSKRAQETGPKARFTIDFSPAIQIPWKCYDSIPIDLKWLLHSYMYVDTVLVLQYLQ